MKKRYYVFFTDSVAPWYLRGLKENSSHVFVLEHTLLDGYDLFLRTENLRGVIETSAHFMSLEEVLKRLTISEYKMLKVDVDIDIKKYYMPFEPLTCVSLTKKLLGINKPLIFTPYQLYRHLRRRNNG